ncbi:MAG: helix-turn-helix domain-containing protein [Oleiphilaceae bacterium]|nr:helix-turn-helix domain-containing protein [Oleiphilaceae bacterium]
MDTIGRRIRHARRRAGLTQPELAGLCGWSGQSRISNYERGIREPRSSDIRHLARALNVSQAWLWTGEDVSYDPEPPSALHWQLQEGVSGTPAIDDDVFLPCLDPQSRHVTLRFSQHLLGLARVDAANASFTLIHDQRMHPVLPSGAVVAFDRASARVRDGELYVLDHNGQLRVCHLFRQGAQGLRLVFASDQYPDEYESHSRRVIGRVFWWSVLC